MFSDDQFSQYPLRQSLLPDAEGLRILEARGAVDWLSRPDRYLVVCEGRGGRIFAADERFLDEAQHVIATSYGARVTELRNKKLTYLGRDIEPGDLDRLETRMFLLPAKCSLTQFSASVGMKNSPP